MSLLTRWRRPAAPPAPAAGEATDRGLVTVAGVVAATRDTGTPTAPAFTAELTGESGRLDVVFLGRRHVGGLEPGRRVQVHGRVGRRHGVATVFNPDYVLLPGDAPGHDGDRADD